VVLKVEPEEGVWVLKDGLFGGLPDFAKAMAGERCWVLGTGCWVLGTGYWVLGTGYWVLGTGEMHGMSTT